MKKHCESDSDNDRSVLGNQPKTNKFPVEITQGKQPVFTYLSLHIMVLSLIKGKWGKCMSIKSSITEIAK